MISVVYFRYYVFIVLQGLFLFCLTAFTATAGTRVVDTVEISSRPAGVDIYVNLNLPLQYVTHTPSSSGDILQIQLRSISASDFDVDQPSTPEDLSWKPSEAVPLSRITYEEDRPGRPTLTLRFLQQVQFQVRGSSDLRSVVIFIPSSRAEEPESQVGLKTQAPTVQDDVAEPETEPSVKHEYGDRPERVIKAVESELVAKPTPSIITADENKVQPVMEMKSGADFPHLYAINLMSSVKAIDQSSLPKLDISDEYQLYTTVFEKGGVIWHRLRLGYFPTKESAQEVLDSLRETYPRAWVTRVKRQAAQQILDSLDKRFLILRGRGPEKIIRGRRPERITVEIPEKQAQAKQVVPVLEEVDKELKPLVSEERLANLMTEAEVAMTGGNYRRAIQLYTKILESPDNKFQQQALEFLGLARERNGQLAHAKAIYEEYLGLYPEGEGTARVRQRLAGLITARAKPKEKLRKAKKAQEEEKWQKDMYGGFSLFYTRDESFSDLEGSFLNQSLLSSDLDLTVRVRKDAYDIRSLFIGGYEKDFRDESDDESRVNTLYLDASQHQLGISGRVGRQSLSTGGVLGRFDGGLFGFEYSEKIQVNVVAGFPVVLSTSKGVDTDTRFYGLNFDLGTFANHWDFNSYIINQEVNGIEDRRAVGGEVRYFDPNRSFFSLIDYDILFDELNIILFTGSWIFPDNTTCNVSADYRKSPILTTTNAIQGQGVESVSDLTPLLSEKEIRSLAEDRTADSRTFTFGLSRPLHKKLQISGDVTMIKLSSTKASGGVEATPGTDNEFFYSLQLIGSSLIKEGDIAILGLSYSDTTNSETISLNLNTRYPFNRELRINPRLRFDYRRNRQGGGELERIRPSIRMDYRWKKRTRLELEGGGEWSSDTFSDQTDKTKGYFLNLGYRLDI